MDQPAKARPQGEQEVDRPHGFPWLLWVTPVFLAYLLALAPAAKLHQAIPKARPVIETIYFWAEPLARSSPHFAEVVKWYYEKVWLFK